MLAEKDKSILAPSDAIADMAGRHWLMGNASQFRRDSLGTLTTAAHLAPITRFRFLNRYAYLLTDPEDIKHVLVDNHRNYHKGHGVQLLRPTLGNGLLTSEGEFHARQRRLIQPAFHRQRIAAYADVITRCADEHLQSWQPGAQIDLHEELMHLTMVIVAKCLFGVDVSSDASKVGEAINNLVAAFNPNRANVIGRLVGFFDRKGRANFLANRQVLDDLLQTLIRQRRAEGGDRGDLLSMLLHAQDDDNSTMSDEQARDEMITLFIAGHETTAIALTWSFYLLAQYPSLFQRLHEEANAVIGVADGQLASWEHLPKLEYARRVFAEAMRLYPPAWITTRRSLEADEIGGHHIPANTGILVSPWATQRHERWWPDPLRFNPDRFTPEAEAGRPKFAYFPFGGGPRRCIGEPFALMEGALLLSTLAQRIRFTIKEGYTPTLWPQVTLRPRHGMPMNIHAW